MARRKDHSREELSQLAIEAGRQLVSEGGVGSLTARSVAARIGYTPGTLYNLFEGIDGLVSAINTCTLSEFALSIENAVSGRSSAKLKLRRICAEYLKLHAEQRQLWELLFATPLKYLDENYHDAVRRVFDPVVEVLLPISGSAVSARRDAKIIWAALHGICLLQSVGKLDVAEPDPLEVLVERFLRQFLSEPK